MCWFPTRTSALSNGAGTLLVKCYRSVALFLGLPRFCSSVCIQYRKSGETWEGLRMDAKWMLRGGGQCLTTNPCTINLRASFLRRVLAILRTSQVLSSDGAINEV